MLMTGVLGVDVARGSLYETSCKQKLAISINALYP